MADVEKNGQQGKNFEICKVPENLEKYVKYVLHIFIADTIIR